MIVRMADYEKSVFWADGSEAYFDDLAETREGRVFAVSHAAGGLLIAELDLADGGDYIHAAALARNEGEGYSAVGAVVPDVDPSLPDGSQALELVAV